MRAIYLWSDKSSTPLSFFLPLVEEKARSLGWEKYTVFSDGWDEPEDWNMMLEYVDHQTNRLTDVLFLNFERWHGNPHLFGELRDLHEKGVIIHSVQGIAKEVKTEVQMLTLMSMVASWEYFQDVMSLKTREGMRHKRGGRLPFGLTRGEDGKPVKDENWPIVERAMGMRQRGVPVPEIAKTMNLKQTKVRSIIRAWEGQFSGGSP